MKYNSGTGIVPMVKFQNCKMNFTKSADGRISDQTFNLGNKIISRVNKLEGKIPS